jgi:hypothetical protein
MDTDHSQGDREHQIDLTELEHRLAAWRPAAGALDRDRMLYDAGRAAALAGVQARSWRLATAALALLTIGLGGLLAREQSQRRVLETALAARAGTLEPAPAISSPARETPAIEPLEPSSYFVLTARLTQGAQDLSAPDVEIGPEPRRRGSRPPEAAPQTGTLRPGDVERVLDL